MQSRIWKFVHAGALLAALAHPAVVYGQFYLGAAAGQAEYKDIDEVQTACADVGAACSVDKTDNAFKLFAGYRIAPYLAVEGGYLELGEAAADAAAPLAASATLSAQGGYIAVLPHIPIGALGSIFGRVGLSALDTELAVTGAGATASDSSAAAALVFGVGAEIRLNDTLSIRGEWERHSPDEALDIAGVEVDTPDIDVLTAGLAIRF